MIISGEFGNHIIKMLLVTKTLKILTIFGGNAPQSLTLSEDVKGAYHSYYNNDREYYENIEVQ